MFPLVLSYSFQPWPWLAVLGVSFLVTGFWNLCISPYCLTFRLSIINLLSCWLLFVFTGCVFVAGGWGVLAVCCLAFRPSPSSAGHMDALSTVSDRDTINVRCALHFQISLPTFGIFDCWYVHIDALTISIKWDISFHGQRTSFDRSVSTVF